MLMAHSILREIIGVHTDKPSLNNNYEPETQAMETHLSFASSIGLID